MSKPLTRFLPAEDVHKYGFRWGPVDVTRLFSGRSHHVVGVDTDFHHVQICVSNGGRKVHVFVDGDRWSKEAE